MVDAHSLCVSDSKLMHSQKASETQSEKNKPSDTLDDYNIIYLNPLPPTLWTLFTSFNTTVLHICFPYLCRISSALSFSDILATVV